MRSALVYIGVGLVLLTLLAAGYTSGYAIDWWPAVRAAWWPAMLAAGVLILAGSSSKKVDVDEYVSEHNRLLKTLAELRVVESETYAMVVEGRADLGPLAVRLSQMVAALEILEQTFPPSNKKHCVP